MMDWIHLHILIIILGVIIYISHDDMSSYVFKAILIGLLYGLFIDMLVLLLMMIVYFTRISVFI